MQGYIFSKVIQRKDTCGACKHFRPYQVQPAQPDPSDVIEAEYGYCDKHINIHQTIHKCNDICVSFKKGKPS